MGDSGKSMHSEALHPMRIVSGKGLNLISQTPGYKQDVRKSGVPIRVDAPRETATLLINAKTGRPGFRSRFKQDWRVIRAQRAHPMSRRTSTKCAP